MTINYEEKAKWIVEVLTYQRKFAGRTELPVHGWEVDVSLIDEQIAESIGSLTEQIEELKSKAGEADAAEKGKLEKELEAVKVSKPTRIQDQKDLIAKRYQDLAAAIKLIVENRDYAKADDKLSNVPLPVVNGKETALKLHARMIVESYREDKAISRNGKWNSSPVYAFFAHSSLMSNSAKYIQNLEKFIRDAEPTDTKVKFDECFQINKQGELFHKVGARLDSILIDHGVKTASTPEKTGEAELQQSPAMR